MWRTFGDFIGGTLNPALSFLGLIALLYTIYLQSKELSYSKEELRNSTQALRDSQAEQAKSAKALAEQSKTFELQQFEQTFFSLLEQHNKVLESLSQPNSNHVNKESKIEELWCRVFDYVEGNKDSSIEGCLEEVRLQLIFDDTVCNHYFRILYQLLKYSSFGVHFQR